MIGTLAQAMGHLTSQFRVEVFLLGKQAYAELERELEEEWTRDTPDKPAKPPGWPPNYGELNGAPILISATSRPDIVVALIRDLEGELIKIDLMDAGMFADMAGDRE